MTRLKFAGYCLIAFGIQLSGCQYEDPEFIAAQQAMTPILNFDDLHHRLTKLNFGDVAYFDQNWPSISTELHGYIDDGQLGNLHVQQQEIISMDLHYLAGCFNGHVKSKHGSEIKTIADNLELSDETRQLIDSLRGSSASKE